ncbi:MAG: transcription antitermination factor NusB [Peptoniphilus duerdenii]|uniref:transcription antitermination factor NusB n=1 Tax=Peptoniphilus duerdenii TaxID=507750 RepID=UPI00254F7705|nr:transcription antitermination factor NusB [Peptoniphilus duerdenii]MDK8275997.1 transcription antitermination factor NusB [Peptoniphilus duerdenii]
MSRRVARRGLMKLLYQMDMNDDYSDEAVDFYFENSDLKEDEVEFIREHISGMIDKFGEIDEIIKSNLEGWSLERISNIDRQILRIAVYELYFTSTASNIVINEAVEIAREYSSNEAPKFINGILGTIFRKFAKES